jgi:hypothetical protein
MSALPPTDDRLTLRDDDIDAFFDVPFVVYGPDTLYVSPLKSDLARFLDPKKNPLFGADGRGTRRVITAHRGGRPVGRIVAHLHGASNEVYAERRGNFGFFDCEDDVATARILLDAAETFARANRCDRLEGNFNLTAMQQMGVLTEGFDGQPYSDMQYNPPHIPRLLEACGYQAIFPVSTFETDLRTLDPEVVLSASARARLDDPALKWEPLAAKDFERVLRNVRIVLNDGFANNPMFVPLTDREMFFQAKDLSMLIDPRITSLVSDADGPAGVVLCIPDLNPMIKAMRSRYSWTTPWHLLKHRMSRKRAVIIFYSVAQRRQNQGLNGAMLFRVTTALKAAGYEALGITWIADINAASIRQVERLGGRRLHRLHLFTKTL